MIAPSHPSAPASATPSAEDSVFVFPATAAQRRFWLLDQLRPGGNPALNMTIGQRWRGPLEPEALERALNAVVARHEVLRTTFGNDRGQLTQLIAPALEVKLAVSEADRLPGPESLTGWMEGEAREPFDLDQGPLLRARLVRLGATDHLLLLTVHHIVSDGFSNGLLVRDLAAIYTADVDERSVDLPTLPIQFADYAEWQEARLAGDDFAAQRDYWKEKLAGALPALDLPFDHPRTSGPVNPGALRSSFLPAKIARAAKAFAASENASRFMLFLAAFQALLHRYSGQSDFLITTPSANRDRPEFASLVGLFVNPLLLRADLKGEPTFRQLLRRVRQTALEAFSNQDIPFESLLDEFRAPQLQVNFHYDAGLQQPLSWPTGLTKEALPAISVGAVYELSLSLLESPEGLRLEVEYDSALFEPATIDRLLKHYQNLLQNGLRDPDRPIAQLPFLSAEEERRFAATPVPESDGIPPLDIWSHLNERVMAIPDAVAARHGRRELSCAWLVLRLGTEHKGAASQSSPSDLGWVAAWIAHWRERVETALPPVVARPPETLSAVAAASVALRECGEFSELERVASCSPPSLAAMEEIGASLMANTILVYPTPDVMADSAVAFAAWLEAENIAVAYLPAAMWNRLNAAFASRNARQPATLRMVIASEGNPNEGGFGRVVSSFENGIRVCRRVVVEEAGGTVRLDERILPLSAGRRRVIDPRSGQLQPIGIAGELAIARSDGKLTKTGEMARWLPNESMERLGSIAEQRYAHGRRIAPRQTEEALCALPGVRHALVRPQADEPDAPLTAYLVPDTSIGALPDDGNLRQPLREQGLPDAAVPQTFIVLKDVPLLASSGHVDLEALANLREGEFSGTPEPVRPYLGLQLQLIAIWEEVLEVSGIGIRDDFFELGGNSLLAMRMLQRAESACGKTILPAALFRHPTIEHLAGEIAREARDESPELLRVHDAGTRTPIFYLHGDLSGGGFYSLKLSRALGADQPFYVLPPHDIRLLSAAPTIEEMAAAHLQALRAVRPHGPYVISGFCIGGLVAYELAQQIKAAGEKVEMLLIIDAAPDRTLRALRRTAGCVGTLLRWKDEVKVAQFGRWAIWRARLALKLAQKKDPVRRAPLPSLGERFTAARAFFARRRQTPPVPAPTAIELEQSADDDRDLPSAFRWASAGYRPKIYDGPVALLLSEDVLVRADNVSRIWQQIAPGVTVEPLRGSHLECITAHVDSLAEKIEDCLRRTDTSIS